jgi:hypothetical protein
MKLLACGDPEDARKLLDPIIEHMMEAVHRYEGTVKQVMGTASWLCSARRWLMKIMLCGLVMRR